MDYLDVRTLTVSAVVTFTICTMVMVSLWSQHGARFAGLGLLVFDFALATLAMILIQMRDTIPDVLSIGVANSLAFLASLLGLMGLERFVGLARRQTLNFALFAVYSALFLHYSVSGASLAARNLTLSVGLAVIWAQCAWLLLARTPPVLRPIVRGVGLVYIGYCVINVLRVLHAVVDPEPYNVSYMKSGGVSSAVIISYTAMFLLLTVSLVLMLAQRLGASLHTEEAKYATAFRSNPLGMILTRLDDGRVLEANENYLRLVGHPRGEVIGGSTVGRGLWESAGERDAFVARLREAGRVRDLELPVRRPDGETLTCVLSAEIITINGDKCILATLTDITERKRFEEEVRQLSLVDTLTGLRNRRGFLVAMEQLMKQAVRDREKLYLVFLDADGLKKVNDVHGHEEGDRALTDVAHVLRATFRDSDVIARFGGDEFGVCVMGAPDRDADPERFLARLAAKIDEFARRGDRPYRLSLSWGLSVFDPAHPRTIDDLLTEADAAMYQHKRAKREGRA